MTSYNGNNCPNCGKTEGVRIDGSLEAMGVSSCFQDMTCKSCGAEYVEFYEITHAEVRMPDMDEPERINMYMTVLGDWENYQE